MTVHDIYVLDNSWMSQKKDNSWCDRECFIKMGYIQQTSFSINKCCKTTWVI